MNTTNELAWPENIVADRHETSGKWVIHYATDKQAAVIAAALTPAPAMSAVECAREIVIPPLPNGSHMDNVHDEIYEKNVEEAAASIHQYAETYAAKKLSEVKDRDANALAEVVHELYAANGDEYTRRTFPPISVVTAIRDNHRHKPNSQAHTDNLKEAK